MDIRLERAELEDKERLFALMQRYIKEFSAFEPVMPDKNGIYPYANFDRYFSEKSRLPFFITAGGETAGLILVNRTHYVRLWHPSRSIAEFYVCPEYRRHRVGTAAARKLVESMGGWWQLMMHPKNKPSHEFWKRTFDYPGVQFVSTRRGPVWYDGDLRGTVMTFKVKKK